MKRLSLTMTLLLLLATAGAARAAVLTGSFSTAETAYNSLNNLTSEGALDWRHWVRLDSDNGGSEPDESLTPTQEKLDANYISDLTIPSGSLADTTVRNGRYTWTDGTPTLTGTSDNIDPRAPTAGIGNTAGVSLGLTVGAPSTQLYRLHLYIAGFGATGTLTASLPGVDDYVQAIAFDTSSTTTQANNNGGVFTIDFMPATLGDQLTLTWVKTGLDSSTGFDNISIEAAALSRVIPAPAALPAGLTMLGLLGTRRRIRR